MTTDSTTTDDDANLFLGAAWFYPIEAGIRGQIRGFIEALIGFCQRSRQPVSPMLS